MRRAWLVFGFFLALQAGFWWHSLDYKPKLEIVPSVPGSTTVKAISFGDSQFFFRLLGFYLQNFGDTYGRYTPLKEYDYARLNRWFYLLDELDNTSNYIPAMASYYFSQTQRQEDVAYVVDYLRHHAKDRMLTKWWWQVQAAYIAQHRLGNTQLALEIALPLANAQNVPLWVNQLPAFIYEQQGEFSSALEIMTRIQQNIKDIPPGELSFMRYFVEERLKALDNQQKQNKNGAN